MSIEMNKSLLAIAVSALLVSACSNDGGGSSAAGGDSAATTSVTATDSSDTAVTTLNGVFWDGPVSGLSYQSGSMIGQTDAEGTFAYETGQDVGFTLGSKVNLGATGGKSVVSPLDLVPGTADDRIWPAIASLLQSLDADGNHDNGINISPAMVGLLDARLGGDTLDFSTWDEMSEADLLTALNALEATLTAVVADAAADDDPDTSPVYIAPDVAAAEVLANLVQVSGFVKNISKTPEADSDKAGIEILDVEVAARSANGELVTDGEMVHPLLSSYADAVGPNGEEDPFVAISYDNGMTWKRTNLFKKAGREMTINHLSFNATSSGPNMVVAGDYIMTSWTSTFCPGAPGYASEEGISLAATNPAADLLGDIDATDTAATDWFKVLGSQRTVTYVFDDGSYLTNPYHCVWAVRGVVDADGSETGVPGEIVWRVPEQLTSGVRDAKLDTPDGMGPSETAVSGDGFGFAITWQEDPEGLLPGEGEGPGVGWSGATTHHKTDVWYSFLRWDDFAAVETTTEDLTTVDAADDTTTDVRPKVANTFSVPAPVSNNDSCRVDSSGTLRAYCDETLVAENVYCPTQEEAEIKLGTGNTDIGTFCVTEEGAILDGNTGASRPQMTFAPVLDDENNIVGARALLMYEETKGFCDEGGGCPDAPYDTGKLVMYHHMPAFDEPQMVAEGDILSEPVQAATFDPLSGESLTPEEYCNQSEFCEPGDLLYENTRRDKFVANTDPTHDVKVLAIYKQGYHNQGERADIFGRRAVGGYDIEHFSPDFCVSCVRPTDEGTEVVQTGDYSYSTKVTEWDWQPEYVDDESWVNPYDDARSLRAKLDGDRILIAYAWTPNWLLTTTLGGDGYFKDNHDFMVRRSFQPATGATITDNGDGTTSVSFTEAANQALFFEPPIDTSHLANNHETAVEPRLVTVGGSILNCPANWGVGEVQDPSQCDITGVPGTDKFVITYCTAINEERVPTGGAPTHLPGLDCYYSWTTDNGETFVAEDDDGDGLPDYDCLACDNEAGEVEPENVLTPDGMILHSAWVANGELEETGSDVQNGSDVWYGQFSLEEQTTEE